MKIIKFRGYDGMDWIHGSAVQYDKETDTWYMIENGAPDDDWSMVGEIGQFTGLKDSKGKEVYEGDIVTFYDLQNSDLPVKTGYVDFKNGSFVIYSGYSSHYRWMDYVVEVIGNVHENKELLEDQE